MRLLLVEDDPSIAASLVDGLRSNGFRVDHVSTGAGALAANGDDIDLVLLDLGLPDLDGHDVCRQLRVRSSTPVIMLTARSDEIDRVLGFELGADDYVTKPFSLRELVARIRAVTRRSAGAHAASPEFGAMAITEHDEDVCLVGQLAIDRRTRRVRIHETEIDLTTKELDLLAYLASDVGAVHTRSAILEGVWDAHWYGPTKTVDAHVASLRKKLGDHRWITAVRGVGFRLEPPS